jgi:hypothetical protein
MYRTIIRTYDIDTFKQDLFNYYNVMQQDCPSFQLDNVGAEFVFNVISKYEREGKEKYYFTFLELEVSPAIISRDFYQTNISNIINLSKGDCSFYERDFKVIKLNGTNRNDLIVRIASPLYYLFNHLAEPIIL